jgi:hypothetical protein
MNRHDAGSCPYELAHGVQFRKIEDDLVEVRDRVARLETALGRGLLLLTANLACVAVGLARQIVS